MIVDARNWLYIMARLKCILRVKILFKLLLTLSWMSGLIYVLLLKLADQDLTKNESNYIPEETGNVLLSELGFIHEPKLYPQGYHQIDEKEWPVFVLSIEPRNVELFIDFILSFRKYFLDHRLVIYNLGLNGRQKEFITERCYCQMREVQWKKYPKHVQNLRLLAYLPLLIQDTLQEFGTVFWCDISMRFNTSMIKQLISNQAQRYGIAAWTRDLYPTSTYTHYSLYNSFNTNQSNYFFHQMVYPVPALYYNVALLHVNVMQPWVSCALQKNCVSPVGAQATGCNLNLKPRYRYSGCHRYSISVLNILLGKTFQFETPYIAKKVVFDNILPNSLEYFSLW